MPDFNQNEMDALFRNGAEKHEFEYNPDAWTLMEAKLDKKARKRRVFFYLLGIIFFLAAVASYAYFNPEDDMNQIEMATSISSENGADNREKGIIKVQTNKEDLDVQEEQEKQEEIKSSIETITTTKEYISTDSKESGTNIGAQHSFQSENTGNLMGHEIVSIDSQTDHSNNKKLEENNIELIKRTTAETNSVNEENLKLGRELLFIAQLGERETKQFESKMLRVDTENLKVSPTRVTTLTSSITNRWSITAFANPEWSSVGLFKASKTGWSLGTKIGYQFAEKFEISAGIAYSRKIYKGGGEAYTMDGGWYDNIEPMRMDAKCDVIEIPIGLSYHINGFRNSGFFVDLGINSYMLHSEWYGFEYSDSLVRPDRYMEVNEDSENSHLIGVGRVAIGYQKVISNNTSFQVAPYLQFPLTGIGAGRVNVYSSGVQLAVKFNTQ